MSIGLPVWNGEQYLRLAVDSVLEQTFSDFELIISDNGSTDATESICREYAERDPRVSYHRQPANRGAAWNFNHVVELARGELFKWMAHDDLCAPTFVERCVAELDARPQAVLAYTVSARIDEAGQSIGTRTFELHDDARQASTRFRYQACVNHWCHHVFGIMRSEALARTDLIGPYTGSDRILLAHLALLGPFVEIDEPLFVHREHAKRSTRALPTLQSRAEWFDPSRAGRLTLPNWKLLAEYGRVIPRSDLSWMERLRCRGHLARWSVIHARKLLEDVRFGLRARLSSPGQRISRLPKG